jgi:hypothetical protein
MSIQPIETVYKGYRFRSRLEARWAVFFDTLGIAWEYEKEGFQLSDGEWYLPDFWLPSFCGGIWAEIKPQGGQFRHIEQFVIDSKQAVWLCEGVPALRAYDVWMPLAVCAILQRPWSWDAPDTLPCPECAVVAPSERRCEECEHVRWDTWSCEGIPNFDQALGENRMFWSPGYENQDGTIPRSMVYGSDGKPLRHAGPLLRAVVAARSARFEHGETPWIPGCKAGGTQ